MQESLHISHGPARRPTLLPLLLPLLLLLLSSCATDPRVQMRAARSGEIRAVIIQRHGHELSDHELEIIAAAPDWFHTIALEGTPPSSQWVWLLGDNRELTATFAGRMDERITADRVTTRLGRYQDPALPPASTKDMKRKP